jgi:hypothetical protein
MTALRLIDGKPRGEVGIDELVYVGHARSLLAAPSCWHLAVPANERHLYKAAEASRANEFLKRQLGIALNVLVAETSLQRPVRS